MSDVRMFITLGGMGVYNDTYIGEFIDDSSGSLLTTGVKGGKYLRDPMKIVHTKNGPGLSRLNLMSDNIRGSVEDLDIDKLGLIALKNIRLDLSKSLTDIYNQEVSGIVMGNGANVSQFPKGV